MAKTASREARRTRSKAKKKQLRVNAFSMNTISHMAHGLWRHPRDRSREYKTIEYWTDLVKLLERGKFDGLMFADILGIDDVYDNSPAGALKYGIQVPINDPLMLVSAMAACTTHLGITMTGNLTYEHPYLLARRMSTLDHLTRGRWGWNIVTGHLDSAARAMGRAHQIAHDDRYDIADDYMEVVYKLWEGSWEDDAVICDAERGIYTQPEKVHRIQHRSQNFTVDAVHLCEPSPQRTPILFQAGSSKRGQEFAARHAECILISAAGGPTAAKPIVDNLRRLAKENGRDPDDILVFASTMIVVAPTEAEARDKFDEYQSYSISEAGLIHFSSATGIDLAQYEDDEPIRFGEGQGLVSVSDAMKKSGQVFTRRKLLDEMSMGNRGKPLVGSSMQVADMLQEWMEVGGLDGLNLHRVHAWESYSDFIDLVVPELQSRGLYKTDYAEGTFREKLFGPGRARLPKEHTAAQFRVA